MIGLVFHIHWTENKPLRVIVIFPTSWKMKTTFFGTGAVVLWQPSHHPSECCTLVVVEERPPTCKALLVYNNTQKALYKFIIHSFIHSIELLPCYLLFHYPFHCLSGTACNHSMSLEMVPKVLLVVCAKTLGGEKKMQELEDEWMRKRATDEEKAREKEKGEKTGCRFSWARSFIGVSLRAAPYLFFLPLKLKSYNDTPVNKVIWANRRQQALLPLSRPTSFSSIFAPASVTTSARPHAVMELKR